MPKVLGIDLGTANTFIYAKGQGIILRSPSVVAIDRESREVVAIGTPARKMLGKTPKEILACRPLKNGVIADLDVATKMVRRFLEMTDSISFFSRPVIIAGVPYGVTEVEKRAVEDVLFAAGARSVALVEEPIAAAIGSGLRVGTPRGTMLADIGGGTTEIAVISLGRVVASRSLRTAGDSLDDSIASHLRANKSTLVGEMTAEQIKMKIGSAHPSCDAGALEVFGRELRTGHATTATISSAETREAMTERLLEIVEAIRITLEDTPPELSSDIYDHGIMLTGGGAYLKGLVPLIQQRLKIRATVAKNPYDSVCAGIGRIMESERIMGDILKYRGK